MKSFSTPIRFMLISSFFMSFGYFAVYAFLAIYLLTFLHFSAFQVGTVLTVMIITSRVIPLFSGLIADKIGYIIMMIAGLFLRGIGFIALGICLISIQFLFLLHLLASELHFTNLLLALYLAHNQLIQEKIYLHI